MLPEFLSCDLQRFIMVSIFPVKMYTGVPNYPLKDEWVDLLDKYKMGRQGEREETHKDGNRDK